MRAFGTTAPLLSRTVPEISEVDVCASAHVAASKSRQRRTDDVLNVCILEFPFSMFPCKTRQAIERIEQIIHYLRRRRQRRVRARRVRAPCTSPPGHSYFASIKTTAKSSERLASS